MSMKLFIPITKVDATKREVWGVAAVEQLDKSKEILDYTSSKPLFEKWSHDQALRSMGKSLGNLRAMHTKIAAGKLIAFHPNDAEKQFEVGTKIVDDNEWKKVDEGVYTGFSIGGDYAKRWDDPDITGATRYTAAPTELSLVDNPCIPGATFEAIKMDGSRELRKFVDRSAPETVLAKIAELGELAKANLQRAQELVAKAAKTKKVDGEDLPASAFLSVGDPDDTKTWNLPVKFSTAEKSKSHIKNALARFNQVEGMKDKPKVARRLAAAAKKAGIDASNFVEEYVKATFARALAKRKTLQKSMYDVGSLANLMCSLSYMEESLEREADWEGDDSPIPGELGDVLLSLKQIFIDLATEEVNELVAEEDGKKQAAKAASAGPLLKAATAERLLNNTPKGGGPMATIIKTLQKRLEAATSREDLQKVAVLYKKAVDHVAKAAKHVDKIRELHDTMGDCIDGLSEKDAEKLAAAGLAKAVDHLKKLDETHDKMDDEISGAEESLEAAADAEEEQGEKAEEKTEKDEAEKSASGRLHKRDRELVKMRRQVEAKFDELAGGLCKMLETLAGGATQTVEKAAEAAPVRTAITVEKTADGTGVGGVIVPPAGATAAVPLLDNIAPTLPDGMPNPAYVAKMESGTGASFEKAAKTLKPKVGNPFPTDSGKS